MTVTFAPADKVAPEELQQEIERVSSNPVMSGLLQSIGGLLAILNEHRQLIALNTAFLELLGIEDAHLALGLRLGEALGCIHAHDGPGHTCGSTRYCSTCGAAIAIIKSLEGSADCKECRMMRLAHGAEVPLDLQIFTRPVDLNGMSLTAVFALDVSHEKRLAYLNRTFHHTLVKHLKENFMHIMMGFLNLIQQHHTMGTAAYRFRQNTTFAITYIAGRRTFQSRYRMCFLKFTHINGDDIMFPTIGCFSKRKCSFGFAHTRWANQ